MAMQRYKRAVAVTGTYTDKSGNEKKNYVNVGTLFKFDDGGLMLKLDAMPVGQFDGTIKFYDFKEDERPRQSGNQQSSQSFDIDDSIPF